MGLDGVDIILGTEDAFGIVIKDEDMFDIATVGQFYEYVLKKLEDRARIEQTRCPSSFIFYRLRKAFGSIFGINRDQFKLDSDLYDLLPQNRRRQWHRLEQEVGFPIPSLEHHPLLEKTLAPVIWTCFIATFVLTVCAFPHDWLNLLAVAFIPAAIFYTMVWAGIKSLANRLPRGCDTVRAFTHTASLQNKIWFEKQQEEWTKEKVWDDLKKVIVDRLKVDPHEVKPEAHFVKDLGVG